MGNLITRTLTAFWIVIFILGGFWLHPVTFVLTGLILLAGAHYEYYSMIKSRGIEPQSVAGIVTGSFLYLVSTLVAAGFVPGNYLLLVILPATYILIAELYRKKDRPFDSLAHTFFAVVYIAVPFSLFPFAAFSRSGFSSLLPHPGINFSPGIVVGFLILLWANDTAAYFTGIAFGKHRLMERISPKKSWEGFFGGMIFTIVAAWLLSGWFGITDRTGWIIIAIIISVTGVWGDLIESMLKRSIGVKDSGSVMPGHGGFLDRFDSALISFPAVYLFISLFG